MEDIFTIATKDELRELVGSDGTIEMFKKLQQAGKFVDSNHGYLARLYCKRGDADKCETHVNAIQSETYRSDIRLLLQRHYGYSSMSKAIA